MDASGSALVTGASRGIGRAVALELAARGFSVIATMRDTAAGPALVQEARGDLTVRQLDVTRPGTIDLPDDLRVLVNNAGFQDAYLPLETVPLDRLRALLETNVVGQVAVLQQVIPVMRRRGEGVLCTITSSSVLLASPFFGAYRASKAAMSSLCESLLVEVEPFGIRVVEVLPGPVDTDGLAHSTYIPAVEVDGYHDQAERMMSSRGRIKAAMVSPAAAAARIVDTILDDSAPLRSSCDPMGDALLETWRDSTDEELLARARARYAL
jgi:NAD(P)-dependent dehydrogenase (short-subunit alcohol dehydrogenase family)